MNMSDINCHCGSCLECNYKNKCISTIKQHVDISTPVMLEANANIKGTNIKCGEPKICSYSKPDCCYKKNTCEFIVKQTLNVEIPICYSVKVNAGKSHIECNKKDNLC